MIVDDSPGFLAAARRLLAAQGITVAAVASNGEEALQRVEELRPDVVLVDINLGEESGLELAGQLSRRTDPAPWIILISAHAEQNYRDLVTDSPAIGFLPKVALSARAIDDLLGDAATGPRER
ncbi:response regulator [Saccharopolyspora sp. K220]|nr:response regulator [Saccharopolyspora soli]